MDAVSDVLRAVRLSGAVFLNGTFTAPWSLIGRTDAALCGAYLPSSERVVSYHLIIEGSCWAKLPNDPHSAIHLDAGELLVVPQGEAHVMGSAMDLPPTPSESLLGGVMAEMPGEVMTLSHGGGGAATRIVCGFLACDDTLSNPLLSSLPRLFKIDMRHNPRAAWIESSLKFAAAEAGDSRPGGTMVLARLSELLFVEAVRTCIEALPADQTGWLAGVRDRYVGRALSLLHAQSVHPWTVDELARKVGLSRSALAQRFADLLGQPPMQYLARWRMQIASHELLTGGKSLAAIAEQIGYESEAAFSRAFRREFGMPPAGWRRSKGKIDGAAVSRQTSLGASGIASPPV
ncbi:AraC family transcriptional regulator [Paraburkholderia rhynchosiae]|uniref:AraC family transcriptional regulator n=1 Tax=Paraburkholderia rhynchosiae TaxID=487049 RepID=A0A2N7WIH9_9BURK|nr:AraC family transcriptional regulator [Paraburkholderia rhynchosiae]PMS29276.1 AraC family transcriptional regulator [Paraburkholderia rhynchosiae]CAB3708838.1 HTH-type transcriptional activator RhaR [Paraburkholderia rhynchosiae]